MDCRVFGFPDPDYEWVQVQTKTTKGARPNPPNDENKINSCRNKKVLIILDIFRFFFVALRSLYIKPRPICPSKLLVEPVPYRYIRITETTSDLSFTSYKSAIFVFRKFHTIDRSDPQPLVVYKQAE